MKKDINIEIGKRLRSKREFMKYSRKRFSEFVGISSRFLSDIEYGAVGMSLSTMKKVCEILSVTSDYLIFGKEDQSNVSDLVDIIYSLDERYVELARSLLKTFTETITVAKNLLKPKK